MIDMNMKMKYWVICGLAELQRKYGNRFRYDDVAKTLKYKRVTVSEFINNAREINAIETERDQKDLRKVFIIVNEKELKSRIEMAKQMLYVRIAELEGKHSKYILYLKKLEGVKK
jgi:DNA-binding MarR family transcriptional regulator